MKIALTPTVSASAGVLSQHLKRYGLRHQVWLNDPFWHLDPLDNLQENPIFVWCVEHFGVCAWDAEVKRSSYRLDAPYPMVFDTEADWGFRWDDFYFRREEDAALFKLFWT